MSKSYIKKNPACRILRLRRGGAGGSVFTVRKTSNGIGVEKTWPLHSPNVEKVEVVRRGKVRRAKLFYLRDRVGKKAKVKEYRGPSIFLQHEYFTIYTVKMQVIFR